MKMQKIVRRCWLLLLIGWVSGCSGPVRTPVAGRYYTIQSEDGVPQLYFDDPQLGPTYLQDVASIGTAKGYVMACWSDYYMFPTTAATADAAQRAQIGPLTEAACKQKVFQLTGDSLHLNWLLD